MFMGITVILCSLFWFRFKARSEMQQTLRSALDKGQELTPDIIDRLGHPKAGKYQDLRLGVIWLSLAVALALCGFFVPDPSGNALKGCLAGAAFPLALGIGYLVLYRFTGREQ
jgi:hypothetical protein